MLQNISTSSSQNIPLFNTTPLSSSLPMPCGTENRLVILRPTCESFDLFAWSDFPIVEQHEDLPTGTKWSITEEESSSTTLSTASSFDSLDSVSSLDNSSVLSKNKNRYQRRQISFSNTIQVRTHSIVIGDHPCCTGGLPIELGWEYNEDEIELLEDRQQRSSRARRTSYIERRITLKYVCGLTDAQIEKQVTDLKKSKLHHVETKSRSLCTLGVDL